MSIAVNAEEPSVEFKKLPGVYEPSGVVQLTDGRLLIVEDEAIKPFVLLTAKPETEGFSTNILQPNNIANATLGRISDLEAVVKDSSGAIYSITSHSRKSNGKRDSKREKIIRFSIEGNTLLASKIRSDFRKKLIKAFPLLKSAGKERDVKGSGGLNIEGLTFSPNEQMLWIGLRAPLFADNAILVPLLNPRQALERREDFLFGKRVVLLDLDGGGIRDITYDHTLSGYLILSQRENTKKTKAFKLWLWSGESESPPQRVRIDGIKKLKRTEGIAPVRLAGKDQLLLLNDDGNRLQGKAASYVLVDYSALNIELDP